MNNTIFRRKFVLGVLIALVLGFGVHGTVDALTFGRTTGDLQTLLPGEQFTLTFSLNRNSVAAVDDEGNPIYQFNDGGTLSYYSLRGGQYYAISALTSRSPSATAETTTPAGTRSRVYDYDDEQVTITPASGISPQRRIGAVNYPIPSTGTTLLEKATSGPTSLSNSITLVGTAPTTVNSYNITVSDNTPAEDLPDGTVNTYRAPNLVFTIYVVADHATSSTATFTTAEDQIDTGYDNPSAQAIQTDFSTSGTNLEVFYSVDGPGRLYVRAAANRVGSSVTSRTSPLRTSTAATVYLETNGGTNKVTAWFGGQNPASGKTVTYIYRWSTLTQVSGSRQDGAVGAQLEEPFVVELTDSIGAALDGQWVTFPAANGAQYIPFSGTTYRYSVNGTLTEFVATAISDATTADENVEVKTDDSGEAKIFFVPGTAGDYTVTPTFNTSVNIDTPFTGTANTRTTVTNLRIVSGNNQSAGIGQPLPEPLAVIVRYGNERRQGVSVTFTVTSGFFTTGTLSGNNRISTVTTNARGIASVEYVVGDTTAPVDVVATISGDQREVRFTVNGQEDTTQPTTGTLTVTAPASGTAGTAGQPIDVQVTASGGTTNSGQSVTFSSNRGGSFSASRVQTNSNGIATTQFTLPTTAGAVTITASASGYTDDSTTITVQPTVQPTGTLSVLAPTTPISGTAGDTVDIIIDVGSQNVLVTMSGTSFQTVSRTTGNTTTVTIPVRLPSTAGNYVLTASAPGYDDLPIGVSVSEAPPPPPTNVPVNLQIPSGTEEAQTVSVGSSATLRVRVTNANTDAAVGGVEVTFRNSRGNVLERVNTNNNGEATYLFPVTSAIVQTVSATILDTNVDRSGVTPVTFTITGEELLKTLTVLSSTVPPVQGAPGATVPVTIDAGTGNNNVLVTLSGTGFQTVSGRTGSTGTVVINLVLPNTTGVYDSLYARADGYENKLIVVSVSGTPISTKVPVRLQIPSGTDQAQTVPIGSSATLRVLVINTNTNSGQSGVAVTFRDSRGNDLTTVDTNGSGEATHQLPVDSTLVQRVTAIILDPDFDTSGATSVFFTITGTVTQPTPSTRLTIIQPVDGSGQTVNTGGPGASYPLTILLNNENGTPAVNQVATLTVRNAAQVVQSSTVLITDNTGRATTPDTFSLPTAAGQHTITAVSGTQTRTVTVTVVSIKLVKDASDSVSGDNQVGDRGEVLDDPFVLKVVQDITTETPVQGVPVTFTVVDGDGELSTSSSATSGETSLTVRSAANGEVRAYLVLGEDDEDNRVRASVGITNVADVFFDATGALVPYDLEIVSGNNQQIAPNQRSAPMVVYVTDEDGDALEGVVVTFSLRGGSGTLTPRSAETNRNGEAEAELLPRTAGTYFVEARVVGVTSVRFTITVGNLADDIEIVSGNNQRGDPGTELDDPLVVEVLDDDNDPVSGVTVTFSVTAGGGSLSDTSVDTNNRGRAQTYLTLGDEPGRNSVRASVSGVSTRVTFTATAVEPAPPEPDIRLPASRRVDTYWINTDNGTIHRLVGNNVEDIAPSVENVVSLVVTSNRLYWVEKTSNNSGRIRRSNLNGSNIQLIRDLSAAPAGITVDTANNTIYLTNERGKVQAINIDGSGYVPNFVISLTDPTGIAVGDGKVYWITGDGTVQSANVDGSGVSTISSGYDTLNSIAVGGGKVYWTEQTGDDSGKIHSANLNGRGIEELRTTRGAPYGISYDADDDKIYWADSLGRIMQGNRDASTIRAVVSDLVSLGDVAVPSGTTTRPPGTFSKYDVNRDGTVDNTDAALVADALGERPPSNPRLDVNGDGVVNFLDLLLVFDNRDDVNAAPVAVAKNLPTVSREEVQHQIDLLLASDNQSATALYTLAYLQSLLEVVTPEQTRLLANYPNPFNPETWIPYQLATSSEVQITIYNSAGREVRTLSLGHQSEGYYTDRSRAAYWDGCNAIGEHVASGVYFYTLTTDRISATRKMLILK